MTHTALDLLPSVLRDPFARLPTLSLGNWPTPLEPCPRLAAAIGVQALWIKRDDQSGPALGGNKVRHLEYTLAEALAQRAQAVLIAVGEQSNHARQMAALARKVGLLPIVIVNQPAGPALLRGNLLLVALTGADIRYLAADDYEKGMERRCDEVVEEYARQNLQVYRIRPDRSQVLGAAAGLRALLELKSQVDAAGIDPDAVVLSAANGSQAGMVLACRAIGWELPIRGVAPVLWKEPLHERTARFGNLLAQELGWPLHLEAAEILNDLSQIGAGRPDRRPRQRGCLAPGHPHLLAHRRRSRPVQCRSADHGLFVCTFLIANHKFWPTWSPSTASTRSPTRPMPASGRWPSTWPRSAARSGWRSSCTRCSPDAPTCWPICGSPAHTSISSSSATPTPCPPAICPSRLCRGSPTDG
ncbi:MAG: pyridoxal-phosphate dependent enzyme [Caldilinea sp.]|nr:pyridoxal-phosphate dependent enzyme [Caldilinea sp.]